MAAAAIAVVCAAVVPAVAQPKAKPGATAKPADAAAKPADASAPAAKPGAGGAGAAKPKNFDFTGLDLNGRMRTPQLLYFLERANEELERASLEKRSFIPHIVKTVEDETL